MIMDLQQIMRQVYETNFKKGVFTVYCLMFSNVLINFAMF